MIVQWTKSQLNIFIAILISSVYGYSQNIQFGQITVEDGLSNSYVNCMLEDQTGFIWFGTDDGLNRFDGYKIKVFRNDPDDSTSLSDNIIWSLLEDRKGNLWIGTKGEKISKYNPLNEKFDHLNLDPLGTEEINITCLAQDKNDDLWIGTYRNGIYRFKQSQNRFENWQNLPDQPDILSDNFITSIFEDENDNIWIATYNGLNKFDPESAQRPFMQLFEDSSAHNELFNIPIWYLNKSSVDKNSLWIGKLDGIIKYNSLTEEFYKINLPGSAGLQFGNSVSSIVEEKFADQNILWIGTFGGLVRFNLNTNKSERFVYSQTNPTGISSNTVRDLIIDKSGVVWIATENGLNYYSPKRAKFNFQMSLADLIGEIPEFLNQNIAAITQTNNNFIWFGSERGVYGIKNIDGSFTTYDYPALQSLNAWCLRGGDSDNLWIGTYGQGLKELDIKSKKLKSWDVKNPEFNAPAYDYIKNIMLDDFGRLWIGFWGAGLARLNPADATIEYWRNEADKPEGLSYNDVWVIYQDSRKRIWIGTNGGGLELVNETKPNTFIHWKSDKKSKPNLSSNNIYSIHESQKRNASESQTILWIGTANGLNKFIINNDIQPHNYNELEVQVKYFTVNDGLPDNAIESILEDENGNLWIGTSSGISFFNVEEEIFTNYSLADGLTGNTFNSSAAYKSSDGIMFFGSTTGLNYFEPKSIKQSTFSPPVVITDFHLFNQPDSLKAISPLRQSIVHTKEIILSYNQNDFSFEFTAMDFNAPELNKYAYMLEGFDEDWIFSGTRRFVTYTNLDPSEYIFRVKATNSDGVWNEKDNNVSIIINPPIWATWWAYSIYGALFISVLISIRSIEVRRRKKKEEEKLRREREAALLREAKLKAIAIEQEKEIEKQKIRNRIAQDLHDEIGSNLSSISLMSDLIQRTEKSDPDSKNKIKRIHQVAKDSSQAMRDIVWITNPTSDNLKDLITKMNESANDMLSGVNWKFDFPGEKTEINLSPETKRNVFLIFKEALNNIIKHSGAKNVIIKLVISKKNLLLAIKDNGMGFNAVKGFSGNGLKNMQNRATEINGILKLNSSPGKGTTLALAVNITQVRD